MCARALVGGGFVAGECAAQKAGSQLWLPLFEAEKKAVFVNVALGEDKVNVQN